ncbi:MAG: FGGY-family carbohydrate kinase [Dehalococcoidia bacterium]|nr:FGGY-family carbohydrate kinase [Dehalococcoidia bacterium]
MAADPVVVVDAGTSGLRAVVVTADGTVRVAAREPWEMRTPPDAASFGREFHAASVLAALARVIEAASAGGPFAALAFTGQREGMAFVAEDGEAVYLAPNIDARAAAEGMEIDARLGDVVYAATGHLPSLLQAPAKLSWLRRHRPADAAAVRRALPLADWLATTTTGASMTSRSLAVENGLLDIRAGTPPEYLTDLAFDEALLPPTIADGSIAGTVRAGPLAGTPVVLAGADTQCALVGMAAIAAGDCGVPAGWSAPVQIVTATPVFDQKRRTWTGVHVGPAAFVLESNASETGRGWAWACAMLGRQPEDAARLAAQAPPGSDDVMAVLGARAMRASAMSAGTGALTVPLPLVMSDPSPAAVLRSVLEATAYAVRANLEQLEEITGAPIGRLALGGGMSRMPLFAQIVADAVDRPLEVATTPETSALGAAVLASVALGRHASLATAATAMAGGRTIVEPDAAASAVYEDCYGRWCAMADAFDRGAMEGE